MTTKSDWLSRLFFAFDLQRDTFTLNCLKRKVSLNHILIAMVAMIRLYEQLPDRRYLARCVHSCRIIIFTSALLVLARYEALSQLPGYRYKKLITIDNAQVSGAANLIDFPLLISFTDTDLRTTASGGDVTNINGYDIAFTSNDGTSQLDHQIEHYTGSSGKLIAWVRIPSLDYNDDTDIYMYYGKSGIIADPSTGGTWNTDYAAVWHLEETGDGTLAEFEDATINNNDGQGGSGATGSTPGINTSGVIGNAQDFDGTDDFINFGNDASIDFTGNFTIELWCYKSAYHASGVWEDGFLKKENAIRYYVRGPNDVSANRDNQAIIYGAGMTSTQYSTSNVPLSQWVHVAITSDGTNYTFYLNGIANGNGTLSESIAASANDVLLGQGFGTDRFLGLMDEVRISTATRSSEWIATGVNNQNDPSNFYAVGPETNTGVPGGVDSDLALWLKADAGTTGSSPVTAWADQSDNGVDASSTGTPELVVDAVNFNPAIELDGATEYFTTGTPLFGTNGDYTRYAVLVPHNLSRGQSIIGSHAGGNWDTRQTSAGSLRHRQGGVNWGEIGGMAQDKANLLGVRYNGAVDNRSTVNGVSTITAGPINYGDGRIEIGTRNTGAALLDAYVAEVVIYNTGKSDAELYRIESYLALKYGITLNNSFGNYVASDGTTILWDPTTNGAYHNDVAGIGRDDGSGLEQIKSMSTNSTARVIVEKAQGFDNDLDFIVWGNDGGALSHNGSGSTPEYHNILQRTWKATVNGAPGTVSVRMIYANSGVAEDYALHVDGDGDFADGNATNYAPSNVRGDTLTFEGVTISNGDFFTLGVNRAQSPGYVVEGLVLWMKGGEGITGSPITAWADQSAYGNDATQAGASNLPTVVNNFHNFNPAVYFPEGEFGYFDVNLDQIKGTSYNLIAVVERSFPYTENYFLGIESMATVNEGLRFGYGTDTEIRMDQEGNAIAAAASAYNSPSQTPALLRGALDTSTGKTISELRDGNSVSNTDAVTTTIGGTNGGRLGKGHGQYGFTGYVSEVIAYRKALDDTELRKIYTYLAIKYGLTLERTTGAEGDYLASDGTLLWDASANATYHHDIAGIGQDDDSGLYQERSMSESPDAMVMMENAASIGEFDFVLWGNDDGDLNMTTTDKHPAYNKRLTRTWKVSTNGTPGTVDVRFVYPDAPAAILEHVLHVDADGVFAAGTTDYTVSGISGDTITFSNVTFSNGDYFTLGFNMAGPGAVPDDLLVWLKADIGTDALNTSWEDQSGSELDYTTVTGPTVVNNSDNFNPMVEILSGGFDAPSGSELGTDWNVFTVARQLASDNDGRVFDGHSGNYLWGYWGTFRNSINLDGNPSNFNNGIAVTTEKEDLHLFSYKRGSPAASLEARTTGTRLSTFTSTNTASSTRIDIMQGAFSSESSDARIGEVIIYKTTLSASDQQKVESYLAVKYGLTLGTDTDGNATALETPNTNGLNEGDYVAGDGSVLWDASANSSYHYNVAGIGREDAAALDQRKSISINSDAMIAIDKGGSFSNDVSYLLWGHDDGPTSATLSDAHPSYLHILERTWKVAVTGTPGAVSVHVIYTNSGTPTDYGLHIDSDGDFSSGANNYAASSISGDTIIFDNVNLSDGSYFTLGMTPLAPGAVSSDLRLWLKADEGITGSPTVTDWQDLSIHGWTMNIAGTPQISNDINFNPSVDFDNDWLQAASSSIISGEDYTVIVIAKPDDVSAQRAIIGKNTSLSGTVIYHSNTGVLTAYHTLTNLFTGGSSLTPGATTINTVRYGPGGPDNMTRINGFEHIDNSASNATNHGSWPLRVGNDIDFGSFDGKIAEVLLYDRELSDVEINKVESYLSVKYGILRTTSGEDIVASDDAVVWDGSETTYVNDLVTIARDDPSDLYQKQSATPDDSLQIYIDALSSDNLSNTGSITNDVSYITVAHNAQRQMGQTDNLPGGVYSRFKRIWKVTNVNFEDNFTMAFEWEELGAFDINDIRFLVDDDGDFSDASVFQHGDNGLSITSGSIVVGAISNNHIPIDQTSYVTIASASSGTPLPIELIGFRAVPDNQNHEVHLSWSTLQETNNDFFTIEKSLDSQEWSPALTIPGSGNSDVRLDYDAIDQNPFPGLSYYRLRQTDVDGASIYSHSTYVTLGDSEGELTLYPNPTKGLVTIVGQTTPLHEFHITDSQGRDVSQSVSVTRRLATSVTLDLSDLPVGIYSIGLGGKALRIIKVP